MGVTVFSLCYLAWGQTMVWVITVRDLLHKDLCMNVVFIVPTLQQATVHSCLCCRLLDTQANLVQSLVGTLLLCPCSWCTQGFVFGLQESVSPVLWNFCSRISLAFNVKFWVFPLPDLQDDKSVVGPRTFLTVCKFLWHNCSAVCGSSAQQLYGGANGNLLQEGLRHTLCAPGPLQPEALFLFQVTADTCLCMTHSNTQRQVWLSLCGVSGSWWMQGFVWALNISQSILMEFLSSPLYLIGLFVYSFTNTALSWLLQTVLIVTPL